MNKFNRKIILFLMLILIISSNQIFANTNNKVEEKFIDIENHWASNEIKILVKNEVIEGYGDGTFKPNNKVSVSEFLKMLIEMVDYPLVLEGEKWPGWYIATAKKNKLIEESFEEYTREITRSEAAKVIGNYIKLDDITKARNKMSDLKDEEKEIVLKLVNLNIISGYEDGTFRGEHGITRAEACKIVLKAYYAKQNLLKNRNYELTADITNIGKEGPENTWFRNRYEIKNNRIYIYDKSRYGSFNGLTLNQEYVNDKKVINALKALVHEDSYTELKYILDPYIINSVNICYGQRESWVYNGTLSFQIRFYENAYYDVSKSKNEPKFMNDAAIKIELNRMWDKLSELDTITSCSEKNLLKLEEAIGAILGNDVKKEFIDYIVEKRIQAGQSENSDNPKIVEVKKIGKYTINTYCSEDKRIEIFIQRF